MKRVFWIFAFCASAVSAFSQDNSYYYDNNNNNGYYDNSQPAPQPQVNNDYDDYNSYDNSAPTADNFYAEMNAYGYWINYPGYGNVWVPTQVNAGFSPYATDGHWVYSDYGWTWASDYDWGWAAFHYGRWFHDNYYGWMWLPGNEWAPAWVTWGSYDNYYCWAPLAPFASTGVYYSPDPYYWNFVSRDHFCDINLGVYIANRDFRARNDYRNIVAHVNIINEGHSYANHNYNSGPRVNEVEHVTGHNIAPVTINSVNHAAPVHINNNIQNRSNLYNRPVNTNQVYNNNNIQRSQPNYNRPMTNQVQQPYNNQNVYRQPERTNAQNYNQPQQYRPQTQNIQRSEPVQRQINNNPVNYQYQRPAMQTYNQPQMQNRVQQPSYQRSEPMLHQTQQSFASMQRPSFNNQSFSRGRR